MKWKRKQAFLALSVRYFVVVIGLVWSGGPAGNMAHVLLPRFNTEGQWQLFLETQLAWLMDGARLGVGAQLHYMDFLSPKKGFFRKS